MLLSNRLAELTATLRYWILQARLLDSNYL